MSGNVYWFSQDKEAGGDVPPERFVLRLPLPFESYFEDEISDKKAILGETGSVRRGVHCFTCKRISHEEGTCPELSPEQREANRILRLEQKEKEELAAIEAFSAPARGFENHAGFDIQTRYPREVHLERKTSRFQAKRNEISSSDRAFGSEHGDLRDRISNRRDNLAKNVWNRLDQSPTAFRPYSRPHQGGRQDYHERQEQRKEWQPVRSVERQSEDQHRLRYAQEPCNREIEGREREAEDERRRLLKEKAIVGTEMEKETNRDPKRFASGTLVIKEPITTMFPVNQVGPEKRNPSPPRHLDTPIPQIDTRTTVQKAIVVNKEPQLEEQRREEDPLLLSEEEMNLLAEQYGSVDLEMDEEMIDEDDLLEDLMEEVAMVPETQEPPETDATITHVKPASKNQEAQEQLNRAMAGEDLIGEKIQTSSKEARNEKERKQEKQGSKGQKDKPTGVDGKRRNMRSPDTKGLTASKKLAIRDTPPLTFKHCPCATCPIPDDAVSIFTSFRKISVHGALVLHLKLTPYSDLDVPTKLLYTTLLTSTAED
ncbi:hypothetical protein HID58_068093 [Brassica napus]|uniref:Zinc knuckle CX2CX4HX4C domain-containing protein n=1 Tax=Brassica napus TaxID=3708 RepID=A0ABQ7ZKC9_BRANA|nr:hypothetical protein HID58_068093 [Brassica napus]